MHLHQSVSLPMYFSLAPEPKELAALVASIGFEGIELWHRDADFPTWLALAKQHQFTLCSMVGHRAALNRPECHADAERELRASIDIASANGIPNLICFSGNRIPDQTADQAIEAIIAGFQRVTSYAEEKGVTLLLELLNSKVDHKGYWADHTAFGLTICRRINSPRLRLLYDIYHMQVMEGDIIRTLRDHIEWIGHFHTAGNPGRNELGRDQELNYSAIAAAIRSTGYKGFVGHEFLPLGDLEAGLREAYTLFRSE